ncbi:MAG: ribose-phosphate pyrophosphokinase [Deltaproteobacteria bacterium]|nr:ribose-phosphate pyrophosphokinase [Deltaproteobacteria bacterium]MBW2182635.1 ribose-phosphate pyrophosphokinase [Deltaproteobacteria bacterium]
MDKLKVFSGNSNTLLAQEISKELQIPLGKANVKKFSDGEIQVEIEENVRGMDVFVVQSTCTPVNVYLMELLIMMDAMKRASAERVTAVMPYYGYARQDRKVAPRAPITAKLIADLITTAGASRVLTIDLHAGQIQGFFNIPVDHLYSAPVMIEFIKKKFADNLVIVSPDAGGVERARAFGKRLGASLAIIDKRRPEPNQSSVMNIIGEIQNKTALLLDDMVDTAGTLTQSADALLKAGAKRVAACCTHPVLSGAAIERINKSALQELVVTDTIPLREEAKSCKKIVALSVSKLLGEAIKRIHNNDSVSSLFI